ncbi:MAG: IS200/IS605 family transposase [Balneola sp.]
MSPIRKTKHTVYDLKYHFVWIPKYRKKLLKGDVKAFTQGVFIRIAREYGWEIEEMSLEKDHVHLFIHVPPKYAPAQVVQIMKSISAREIFKEFPRLRKQLWGGKFWVDGYFVRSVGDNVTAEIIKRYIRYQDDSDKPRQLELWD